MSLEYCENCNQTIDTDFDAEHFEDNACINQLMKSSYLYDLAN